MSAKIASDGTVTNLDVRPRVLDVIKESDVTDVSTLVLLLAEQARKIDALERRFSPHHIDYEGIPCGVDGELVQLEHGFGGAVRWWVVDSDSTHILHLDPALTTPTTLALRSFATAVVTIRIEETS